jgi:arsenite transporter
MAKINASLLGPFEHYLSLWVGLCIAAGTGLGVVMPSIFQTIADIEYAGVNLVVAVFIWMMIYPMMVNVDFASIKNVRHKPKGFCITLTFNWLVKPFTMAFLGILFFEYLFSELVAPEIAKEYIAGLILLGAAPCTAMVFVWSQLVQGDANYTLIQVSINDIIMIFAFAPLAAFLLGVTDIVVPWETLVISVFLYVVIPLAIGYATRKKLDNSGNHQRITRFSEKVKPFSIIGLLATVVLLFGFQAQTIINKPMIIVLIAVPLLIQSYSIFITAYAWGYLWRVPFNIAAPAALISSNYSAIENIIFQRNYTLSNMKFEEK